MQHQIEYGPAFAWLKVQLGPNETIQSEAGAMVRHTPSLTMETRLNAGRKAGFVRKVMAVFVAIARKIMGGEGMFVNEFKGAQGGEVVFAPSLSGQIVHRKLDGSQGLILEAGAYLASTGDVDAKLKWTGFRSLISGEGLIMLECTGAGDLFFNAYGGVTPVQVNGTYRVDTGHIVAFDPTLKFAIKSVGGLKSLMFSGEGLVCEFSGQGTVYIQSRNLKSLVGWVSRLLP